MTGFGDASSQEDGVHYSAELRSLNNRYFKAIIRLPEEIAGLEAELESALRKRIHRGSLVLTVKMYVPDAQAAHQVNDGALMAYLDHLEAIHRKVRAEGDRAVNIDLTALLELPGVLLPSRDAETALSTARPVVLKLVNQACDKLDAMRQTEGVATAADLANHASVIGDRLDRIRQRAPAVVDEYHGRLRARIDDLLARAELKVNEVDLIREVAIFADRADISEEVARLSAHLDQFSSILKARDGDPAGRTLEFMCQEMLREANTIASKSNDADISRAIVEVKSAIDRIKEQSHNVE